MSDVVRGLRLAVAATGLFAAAAASAQSAQRIAGTLTYDGREVALMACDADKTVYILQDDAEARADAVAGLRRRGAPAQGFWYGEVYGDAVIDDDTGAPALTTGGEKRMKVVAIQNLQAGKNCHATPPMVRKPPPADVTTRPQRDPANVDAEDESPQSP